MPSVAQTHAPVAPVWQAKVCEFCFDALRGGRGAAGSVLETLSSHALEAELPAASVLFFAPERCSGKQLVPSSVLASAATAASRAATAIRSSI